MKLASLKEGRDGALVVVSRDLTRATPVSDIATTMQDALDHWNRVEPLLEDVYDSLNHGKIDNCFEFKLTEAGPPLPRCYQYLDGACYLSHIRRNREARGDTLPDDILDTPLVYQGISHDFMAWNEDIRLPSETLGIDFEAEIAAVTVGVPMGVTADEAPSYIKLFMLLNDVSLRALIPDELKRSFGFLTGKSSSSLGPIAITPDELGDLWNGQLVSGKMKCWVRQEKFGEIESGIDTPFHYGDLIAHVAQTRRFEPGTIIGLGTVSNEDESVGTACIGEQRAIETIRSGDAVTSFLMFGDSVKIDHQDYDGNSIFGHIDQTVGPSV